MTITQRLRRILYVEDDSDIQAIARLALETVGGFEVTICSSGFEALRVASDADPELLLLDVMMPEMDGPTTLAKLRQQPALLTTPAVFMTAKAMTRDSESIKDLDVSEVIGKPFDPMTLAAQIQDIWSRSTRRTVEINRVAKSEIEPPVTDDGGKFRVLLIDDDPAFALLERAFLEQSGYFVRIAPTGEEGLRCLREGGWDIALVDLEMPDLNGLQVVSAAVADDIDTALVVVTATQRTEAATAAITAGALDFLQKPITAERLVTTVTGALERQRLLRQTSVQLAVQEIFRSSTRDEVVGAAVRGLRDCMDADYVGWLDAGQLTGPPDQTIPESTRRFIRDYSRSLATVQAATGSAGATAFMALPGHDASLWVHRTPGKAAFPRDTMERLGLLATQASASLKKLELVAHLEARVSELECARQRVIEAMQMEGFGSFASDLSNDLQDPFHYLNTNLRALRSPLEGLSAFEDKLTHARSVDEVRAAWETALTGTTMRDLGQRLSYVMNGAERLGRHIGDLAQMNSGRTNAEISLQQVVAAAVRIATGRIGATIETSMGEIVVRGQVSLLAQALFALIDNADLAMGRSPRSVIRVAATVSNGVATLLVEDQGVETSSETLDRILVPHFTTRKGAAGLGATAAAKVFEEHGGSLTFERSEPVGLRAIVLLPAREEEQLFVVGEV